MPEKSTVEKAKEDLHEGKSPSTAAENSYTKKSSMSAKANMEPVHPNKPLPSD